MNIEHIFNTIFLDFNDAAKVTLLISAVTAANLNIYAGIFTGLAGLIIQVYFKRKQDKREQTEFEWRKKNNKFE